MIVASTLFNFSIVVLILYKYGKKPLLDFLAGRSAQISNAVTSAQAKFEKNQTRLEACEKRLASLDQEFKTQQSQAAQALEKQAAQTQIHTQKEVERIRTEADLAIKNEWVKVQNSLKKEILNSCLSKSKNYLSQNLTVKDQHQLVEENLEGIRNGNGR